MDTAKGAGQNGSAEVTVKLSDEALKGLTSFDDALALLQETYGEGAVKLASDVLGDGFAMLEDKSQLIGITFVAISWTFNIGDHGEFVAMKVMTIDGRKLVIIDGSTGICRQLSEYSANERSYGGLVVKNGLRRSDYTYKDEKDNEKSATTYYLDVSA